jgi:hypothetical protein
LEVTIEIDRDLPYHTPRDRPFRIVVHAARCR